MVRAVTATALSVDAGDISFTILRPIWTTLVVRHDGRADVRVGSRSIYRKPRQAMIEMTGADAHRRRPPPTTLAPACH